jgi:hypothetical protein
MAWRRAGGAALGRLGEGGREEGEREHATWWAGWPLGWGKENGK